MLRYIFSRLGLIKKIAILETPLRQKGLNSLKRMVDLEIGEKVIVFEEPEYRYMYISRKAIREGSIVLYARFKNNANEESVYKDYIDCWVEEYKPWLPFHRRKIKPEP